MKVISEILSNVYGVGPLNAPAEAVLWAADRIEDPSVARSEVSAVNRLRSKNGRPLVFVPYGHKAF